jgi:type I restriction enzyme, S subunit
MRKVTIAELSERGVLAYGDGYRTRRSEHGQPGYRILRVADVLDGKIELNGDDYVRYEFKRGIGQKVSRAGDIILTTKGTVGRVAIYPHDAESVVYSPQLCYFRVIRPDVIHPRLLAYWFSSSDFTTQAARRANSTDMAAYLNLRDIASLSLSIPSVGEQRAIAEVLGVLDDKIAANGLIARSALGLSRAIYLKEQQAGAWERLTLADAVAKGWLQLGDGYRTKRSEHGEPGLRILRAGDVGPDSINPSGEDLVSDDFRASIGPKASQPGDVVLTTKGTVGNIAVVPSSMEQVVYSPQLCYFRVLDPTHLAPGFLSAWFRSDDLQRQAEVRMFKTDMAPYINLRDIQSMSMPLAPPADQQRIGESQVALERAAHAVLHENSILAKTRDELLPLLMSGKVRVRDAERVEGEVV